VAVSALVLLAFLCEVAILTLVPALLGFMVGGHETTAIATAIACYLTHIGWGLLTKAPR
jgi:hypothetical protein